MEPKLAEHYYERLGVLPTAEQIVIAAAYRALANYYHPDKWHGDPAIAKERMREINEAYDTLKHAESRARYDSKTATEGPDDDDDSFEIESVLSQALGEIEDQWLLAEQVFPDLASYRSRLSRLSRRLEIEYVLMLIESKDFNAREAVFLKVRDRFLKRFFGPTEELQLFGRNLLALGEIRAASKLSKLVSVVGNSTSVERILASMYREFRISTRLSDAKHNLMHVTSPHEFWDFVEARDVLLHLGHKVKVRGLGVFSPQRVEVIVDGKHESFANKREFILWTIKTFVTNKASVNR